MDSDEAADRVVADESYPYLRNGKVVVIALDNALTGEGPDGFLERLRSVCRCGRVVR